MTERSIVIVERETAEAWFGRALRAPTEPPTPILEFPKHAWAIDGEPYVVELVPRKAKKPYRPPAIRSFKKG